MLERLRQGIQNELFGLFESLGKELEAAVAERTQFLARPVSAPEDIDQRSEMVDAIQNLAQGRRPFGVLGFFGKGHKALASIRITGSPPVEIEDWRYVHSFVVHLQRQQDLLIRWNALASELDLTILPSEPSQAVRATKMFGLYRKLQVAVELEGQISTSDQSRCCLLGRKQRLSIATIQRWARPSVSCSTISPAIG